MSKFYGVLQGERGETTRCGHRGIESTVASWAGGIRTVLYVDDKGRECYRVEQVSWRGAGVYRLLASGIVGTEESTDA